MCADGRERERERKVGGPVSSEQPVNVSRKPDYRCRKRKREEDRSAVEPPVDKYNSQRGG